MEMKEDIVIVGAGIAGLATALGLYRLGIRSLVLESSDSLRITGFALTVWTNAWKALDALGIGDSLRQNSLPIRGFHIASADPGLLSLKASHRFGDNECRCIRRKNLLEKLEKELPQGTIRYSSKVVSIEETSGHFKLLHLADGSTLKTRVLIGGDGIHSVVGKWLGFKKPASAGRSAMRGFLDFPDGHGFEHKFYIYFGGGVRFGVLPCDDKSLYWFCTFLPSDNQHEEGVKEDPVKMKQFLLSKMQSVPKEMYQVVERTQPDFISFAELKFRLPWQLLSANIAKDNVCVLGDALHPMTPDLGQGGCSALEDSVVLARCLVEALSASPKSKEEFGFGRIKMGLEKYAKERRWRSFSLITTACMIGLIQSAENKLMRFLRERFLTEWTVESLLRMAEFDFGELVIA